jgi:translation initiation factor IF-2
MSDTNTIRLSKIARELNVGISTIVEFLHKKGVKIDSNPNEKITSEQHELLLKEFSTDLNVKKESEKLNLRNKRDKLETVSINDVHHETETEIQDYDDEVLIKDLRASGIHHEPEVEHPVEREPIRLNVLGKIDIEKLSPAKKAPVQKEEKPAPVVPEVKETVPPPAAVVTPPEPEVVVPPVEEVRIEEPVIPEEVEIFHRPEIKDV